MRNSLTSFEEHLLLEFSLLMLLISNVFWIQLELHIFLQACLCNNRMLLDGHLLQIGYQACQGDAALWSSGHRKDSYGSSDWEIVEWKGT